MPKRSQLTLSRRTVDALRVEHTDTVFWDRDLPGFGVRVYPSGRKVFVVQCRGPAGIRRRSLGPYGALSCEQGIYRGSLWNHILPALGSRPVAAVGPADAEALHHSLRATPSAANRALGVLSNMFALAQDWGLAPPRGNPCRFVKQYRQGMCERFLSADEYRRVGRALYELEAQSALRARAAAALRLLMVTGCRLTEVLTLRWDDVDRKAGELRLRHAKTGPRMVALTPAALRVLSELRRVPRSRWVFAGSTPDRRLSQLTTYWRQVRARAGVEDVRIHDLRHSFASRALALGEPLPMIGRMLGHSKLRSTARYAHLARYSVRESAARVAESIGADLWADAPAPKPRWR